MRGGALLASSPYHCFVEPHPTNFGKTERAQSGLSEHGEVGTALIWQARSNSMAFRQGQFMILEERRRRLTQTEARVGKKERDQVKVLC